MAKLTLDWNDEPEDSFELIGISCHQKDYRLCWEMNNILNLELVKTEDIPGPGPDTSFSRYYYNNEDFMREYYLITNKIGKVFFAPELKQADYILQIYGLRNENEVDDLLQNISGIPQVLMATTFDATKLKHNHPLFFTALIQKKKEEGDLLEAFRIKPKTK